MDRRGFLRRVGFTGAAIVVAPTIILSSEPTLVYGTPGPFAGLTPANHLGAIWKSKPGKLPNVMHELLASYKGKTLEDMLSNFPKTDNPGEFTWTLSK